MIDQHVDNIEILNIDNQINEQTDQNTNIMPTVVIDNSLSDDDIIEHESTIKEISKTIQKSNVDENIEKDENHKNDNNELNNNNNAKYTIKL